MDTTDCYGYYINCNLASDCQFYAHSHGAKMEIYTNGFEAVETTRRSFQNAF